MLKRVVIFCLLIIIVGCGDKSESLTPTTMQEQIVSSQSIFDAPEIDFIKGDFEDLIFGNPEQAIEKIDAQLAKVEAEQGDLAALLVFSSLAQSQIGKKDLAFDAMTKAVQLRPNAELYALRALVLWRGGKMRGAMLDAQYALEKESNLALASMVQGLVWLDEKEMSKACAALNSACSQGQCYGLNFAKKQNQCN